ncbi:TIGR02611 family protein [Streptomyces sp. NBC_00887]|uniref:TIGR02611 family protein n=1 Tax=Streptomyces sp. NBC_00887 TaxID=2975859 RepID=UPI003864F76C|nr:TIGR02611 family protein [Streptomyces sp. NBC_00887]WSY36846.1 TIGR02611 family protein [Streptomyces sp. NBC_00887]
MSEALQNGSPQTGLDTQENARDRALGSRAPSFIKRSGVLHTSWKIGVFIAGLAVVGAGIVLLPLPGPGWVVIFLGVGIWGTEFVWAQLLLRWVKRKVTDAAQKAWDPAVRRRNLIILTVALVLIAAAVYLSVWEYGFVMLR